MKFAEELTLNAISAEVANARQRFPNNGMLLAALVEEVGELANALLECEAGVLVRSDVEREAIQVAAMAVRVIEEGIRDNGYAPTLEEIGGSWSRQGSQILGRERNR